MFIYLWDYVETFLFMYLWYLRLVVEILDVFEIFEFFFSAASFMKTEWSMFWEKWWRNILNSWLIDLFALIIASGVQGCYKLDIVLISNKQMNI